MTQAFNLSQLANGVNTAGQLNAATFLYNQVPVANGGTGSSTVATAKVALQIVTGATGSQILPAGTTAQRDVSPVAGYVRYNSTTNQFEGYGTAWGALGGGATGAGGDQIFVQNGKTINNSYTIPTGQNASSVGPITILSGKTVTIPSGSRWVIL